MWRADGMTWRASVDAAQLIVRHDAGRRGRRRVWEVWNGDGVRVAHGVAANDADAMRAAERAFVRDRSWLDGMALDDLRAYLAACEDAHAEDPDAGWDEFVAAAQQALDRRSGGGDDGARQLTLDLV